MFCSTYNKSLTHAAAGGELSLELSEHLASCEPCRIAFAEEQRLFAAIDSGLRAVANSEVPATLIPRVHVGMADLPHTRRFSFASVAIAGAAVVVAMIVGGIYLQFREPSTRTAANPVFTPDSAAKMKPDFPSAVNPPASGSVSPLHHGTRVTSAVSRASNSVSPEVIVSPEESAGLLQYEAALRERSKPLSLSAVTVSIDLSSGIKPLEIAELELGDLQIPVLAKPESDGETK